MRMEGKVAVVTGAASGFGEEIAKRFAREGASIMVADINDNGSARVVQEISAEGGKAAMIHCDVSSGADVTAMIDKAASEFGRVDVVVNNAGYTHRRGTFLEVDENEFDRLYAINVKSIYHAVQAAVPLMREQGTGNRRLPQHCLRRWRATPSGPDLVQLVQGRRDHHDQIAFPGTRPRRHPRQRPQPRRRRNRPPPRIPRVRHAGEPRNVHQLDPPRPALPTLGHCRRRNIPVLRRSGILHRRLPGGRRRTVCLDNDERLLSRQFRTSMTMLEEHGW